MKFTLYLNPKRHLIRRFGELVRFYIQLGRK